MTLHQLTGQWNTVRFQQSNKQVGQAVPARDARSLRPASVANKSLIMANGLSILGGTKGIKLHWVLSLFLISVSLAQAGTINVNNSMTVSQIQAAINGGTAGVDTVAFGAGTYSITSTIILKCGLAYTGPSVTLNANGLVTPTAILSGSSMAVGNHIFALNSSLSGNPCTQQTMIAYLNFSGSSGIYVQTPFTNLLIQYNTFTNIPGSTNQTDAATFASVNGASNTNAVLTNTTFAHNIVGDMNSCLSPTNVMADTDSPEDYEGACNGIVFFTSINGFTMTNNNLVHVAEGVHINCPNYANQEYACEPPGGAITTNLTVKYNDFAYIHRITWEEQAQQSSGIVYQYNSEHDWVNPYFGAYGVSFACCYNGASAPYVNVTSNVIIFNVPPTNDVRYGYGEEGMGYNAHYDNNMVQAANYPINNQYPPAPGIVWGCGPVASVSNNTVQGNWDGSYIVTEGITGCGGKDTMPASVTGNVTGPTVSTVTSAAPTISPASGAYSLPLTVTLTDPGYTSGAVPQGNSGVWYTTDGSTPVPGSGTAKYLASGQTFVLSSVGTVKAVGMWGAQNQPASYPSGYGFVASAVVSATYSSGGGATSYGNTTSNTAGGTYPNDFNDLYAVTGINPAGYTVNTGTVCIAPGTVTNGASTDIGINSAPTATTEGTTAICHATYTNTSNTSPGCVTVPLNGCGLLASDKAYWIWTITNDPLGPSPLYFSNCGGTCNGAAPTSPGIGTYGGRYLTGTYGSYAAMSSTFTGTNPDQASIYLGVTPAVSYGVTTSSVNDKTSPNYFNDVYAITGSNSRGYGVNAGTVCIAPGTVTNGAKTDIGINTAPSATTEGATALCHATYTNTSTTSPGCVTVPLSGCGTLSPNTPYWIWTITNDPITGSPLYFSNCGGTCNGSAPTTPGVGTYGGFYLHGTYGTYTGMSSAFTGGPQAAQSTISLSLTPY